MTLIISKKVQPRYPAIGIALVAPDPDDPHYNCWLDVYVVQAPGEYEHLAESKQFDHETGLDLYYTHLVSHRFIEFWLQEATRRGLPLYIQPDVLRVLDVELEQAVSGRVANLGLPLSRPVLFEMVQP